MYSFLQRPGYFGALVFCIASIPMVKKRIGKVYGLSVPV